MSPYKCAEEITSIAYIFCFVWSILYTVISEMVILLDAVFLLIYDWRNWEGGLIIAVATAMDVDRIWTIDAFFTFCKNGNLVESASTIIWWKLFKMPLAWLLCYVHAKFIEELWGTLASELDSERALFDSWIQHSLVAATPSRSSHLTCTPHASGRLSYSFNEFKHPLEEIKRAEGQSAEI